MRWIFSLVALSPALAWAQDAATAAPAKVSTGAQLGYSLYELFFPVLVALTGWLSLKLKTLIQANIKNATVAGVVSRFSDSLFTSVKKVEATIKAKIMAAKDPASDGGTAITEAEAAALRQAVWDELKAEYGGMAGIQEFLKVLGLGDVEGWVNNRIEAAVHDIGLAKTAAGSGNAPLP